MQQPLRYDQGDEPVKGYVLVAVLGKGSFGTVWKAVGPGGVFVALKVNDRIESITGGRELRVLSRFRSIRHPHLVDVHGFWLKDGNGNLINVDNLDDPDSSSSISIRKTLVAKPRTNAIPELRPAQLIIAMGLGDKTLFDRLKERIKQGREGIPIMELLRYMEGAAKGIDHLNTVHNIQHCDIKPGNILIVGGEAQVCDFGLAKNISNRQTAILEGTMAYNAPEQMFSQPGAATDQYSLAITYYELRTGQLPFDEKSSEGEIRNMKRLGNLDFSRVTPCERDVLKRATQVVPSKRFSSCAQFVTELRLALENHAPDELDEDSGVLTPADVSRLSTSSGSSIRPQRSFGLWIGAVLSATSLIAVAVALFFVVPAWKTDERVNVVRDFVAANKFGEAIDVASKMSDAPELQAQLRTEVRSRWFQYISSLLDQDKTSLQEVIHQSLVCMEKLKDDPECGTEWNSVVRRCLDRVGKDPTSIGVETLGQYETILDATMKQVASEPAVQRAAGLAVIGTSFRLDHESRLSDKLASMQDQPPTTDELKIIADPSLRNWIQLAFVYRDYGRDSAPQHRELEEALKLYRQIRTVDGLPENLSSRERQRWELIADKLKERVAKIDENRRGVGNVELLSVAKQIWPDLDAIFDIERLKSHLKNRELTAAREVIGRLAKNNSLSGSDRTQLDDLKLQVDFEDPAIAWSVDLLDRLSDTVERENTIPVRMIPSLQKRAANLGSQDYEELVKAVKRFKTDENNKTELISMLHAEAIKKEIRAGQFNRALAMFGELSPAQQNDPQLKLMKAECILENGFARSALEESDQAIVRDGLNIPSSDETVHTRYLRLLWSRWDSDPKATLDRWESLQADQQTEKTFASQHRQSRMLEVLLAAATLCVSADNSFVCNPLAIVQDRYRNESGKPGVYSRLLAAAKGLVATSNKELTFSYCRLRVYEFLTIPSSSSTPERRKEIFDQLVSVSEQFKKYRASRGDHLMELFLVQHYLGLGDAGIKSALKSAAQICSQFDFQAGRIEAAPGGSAYSDLGFFKYLIQPVYEKFKQSNERDLPAESRKEAACVAAVYARIVQRETTRLVDDAPEKILNAFRLAHQFDKSNADYIVGKGRASLESPGKLKAQLSELSTLLETAQADPGVRTMLERHAGYSGLLGALELAKYDDLRSSRMEREACLNQAKTHFERATEIVATRNKNKQPNDEFVASYLEGMSKANLLLAHSSAETFGQSLDTSSAEYSRRATLLEDAARFALGATEVNPANRRRPANAINALGNALEDQALYLQQTGKYDDAIECFGKGIDLLRHSEVRFFSHRDRGRCHLFKLQNKKPLSSAEIAKSQEECKLDLDAVIEAWTGDDERTDDLAEAHTFRGALLAETAKTSDTKARTEIQSAARRDFDEAIRLARHLRSTRFYRYRCQLVQFLESVRDPSLLTHAQQALAVEPGIPPELRGEEVWKLVSIQIAALRNAERETLDQELKNTIARANKLLRDDESGRDAAAKIRVQALDCQLNGRTRIKAPTSDLVQELNDTVDVVRRQKPSHAKQDNLLLCLGCELSIIPATSNEEYFQRFEKLVLEYSQSLQAELVKIANANPVDVPGLVTQQTIDLRTSMEHHLNASAALRIRLAARMKTDLKKVAPMERKTLRNKILTLAMPLLQLNDVLVRQTATTIINES